MYFSNPAISVVIASFNNARFISQAIESVLAQSFDDFELIIIDDGSTDNTREIVSSFSDHRIRYFYQKNMTLPVARNNGVAKSSGKFLAFLDADDTYSPDRLLTQVEFLKNNPDIDLVASGFEYVDIDGNLIGEVRPWVGKQEIDLWSLFTGGLTATHAVLIRRESFESVGGFCPDFVQAPDMDLWFRLAIAGCKMKWEPQIICQYRVHDTNLTRNPLRHFARYFAALDKAFSSDRLPEEIVRRKGEIYALGELSAASRLLMNDLESEAINSVRSAFKMDPGLLTHKFQRLAGVIVALQQDPWIKDRNGLRDLVVKQLEPSQAQVFLRTLEMVRIKKKFYNAFGEQRPTEVRRAWLEAARHDPRWLLNRGGWSILSQSIVGFKA